MRSLRSRSLKNAAYEQLARIGKAMASPKRLELLDLLGQSPRTVEELAELAGLSVANASQHLQVLRAARLVDAEKRGLFVLYRLAAEDVGCFVAELRRFAEARLVELREIVRDFFSAGAGDAAEPVPMEEVARRLRAGEAVLVDVRPAEEFAAGHIAGALSVPLPELQHRLRELPRHKEIVAYCRGPYCVMAADAVNLLRRRGFRAVRLDAGVLEWRARRGKVEPGKGRAS